MTKSDRLIHILALLLRQGKATAPQLAQELGVSRRTIGRDVDALCQAGFPVMTAQGQNGGISLMEGFQPNPDLLASPRMQAALELARSGETTPARSFRRLAQTLHPAASQYLTPDDTFLIDFSSLYQDTLARKIEELRTAIEGSLLIRFTYCAPSGESVFRVEPYRLVFHLSSWYLWGFCLARQEFHLFKLNRIEELRVTGNLYQKRLAPPPALTPEKIFPPRYPVQVLFTPDCRWRLVEDFGRDSFRTQPDGRLLFSADFSDKSDLFGWLLTFGGRFELLQPEELRAEMAWIGCSIQENHAEPADSGEGDESL